MSKPHALLQEKRNRAAFKFGACALEGRRRVVVCSLGIGRFAVCTTALGNTPKVPPLLAFSRSAEALSETEGHLGTPSAISLTTAISGASVQAGWGTPLLQRASVPPGAAADAAGSGVLVQAGRESPLFMPAGTRWRAAHPLGVLVQAGRVNPSFMSVNPFRRVRFPLRGPGPGRPGTPRFYSGRARMVSRQRPSTSALSQAPCRRRVDSSVSRTPVPCGSSFQRTGASSIRS